MPIINCININHQGVRAAAGSSSAIPPTSSTTTAFRGIPLILHFICLNLTLVLQQQMGTSASVPDVQAPQQTSVDAP
jgi:hypothetical protein